MDSNFLEPWLVPPEPDLARLAMEAADAAGLAVLDAWPEQRKGGIGFGTLPPFLSWQGQAGAGRHLVLLQAREVGALVPGARMEPLPPDWLADLNLAALARPLAMHPALGGRASVHVVQLPSPGRGLVRTLGEPAPGLVKAVLVRVSGLADWVVRSLPG